MIFLDSSNPKEVEKWLKRGTIMGVTTNPTIMKKDKSGKDELVAIIEMMDGSPVSVELTTNVPESMKVQAGRFKELGDNVNVKIPVHGPKGESNLEVIREMSQVIDINVTACMSSLQLFMGAMAGGQLVSLFGGRVADMGHDPVAEIRKFKAMWRGPRVLLVLGSVREPHNIIDWLGAGADVVTVPPAMLEKALFHPRTSETVQQFLKDAERK
jgi:transaldolase